MPGAPSRPSIGDMPNADAAAGIPRKERLSAKRVAQWLYGQYQKGLAPRAEHAVRWISVTSIMRGIHHFTVTNGVWRPLRPPAQGNPRIRAKVPIMRPYYQWQLGRMNENEIGVTAAPRVGRNLDSFYRADRAQAILEEWNHDNQTDEFFDQQNQHLLYYGLSGWHRYVDENEKTVRLRSIPGPELFPIPYDAVSHTTMDGIMWVRTVSEQWLERQDEAFMRKYGREPDRKMSREASAQEASLSTNSTSLGQLSLTGERTSGATAIFAWLKPSEQRPHGEFMFLLNEVLYRYWGAPEKGVSSPLPNGTIPITPVSYSKRPDDWYPDGFCEDLIAPQKEADRQMASILRSARFNRPLTFVDPDVVDLKAIQDEDSPLIPFSSGTFMDERRQVVTQVPGTTVTQDTATVFKLAMASADKAAGFESRIIFGEAEGRVEGGPANSLLNQNAQTPLRTVMRRVFRAFVQTYPQILDMLKEVWPEQKIVGLMSHTALTREMEISQDQVPSAQDVVISPNPVVAGGTNTLAQILFNLRSMPADDGKGALLSEREFRRSLRMLNLAPPGLDVIDKEEERIQKRISMLIGNGQKPVIQGDQGRALQAMENHQLAIDLLRDTILDPRFGVYSQAVQLNLLDELEFHRQFTFGATTHPDQFDDDMDAAAAAQSERQVHAFENSLEDDSGQFAPDGVAVGLEG